MIYGRDSKGRFAPRGQSASRRDISGKGVPGSIRFENQRQAGGWVHRAFTHYALTKKQAYSIFRARGGSKSLFERSWRQQYKHPKDAPPEVLERPTRAEEAREQSLVNQRKAAKAAGLPYRTWRARHYQGTRLYWEGADKDEWVAEWYPQNVSETTKTSGA